MTTELYRLVQSQMADRYAQKATSSAEHEEALERVLDKYKPGTLNTEWDPLIATPFRYPVPVHPAYAARFRPPYFHRNVWYGGLTKNGAVYEFSFHFLRQRVHLKHKSESGLRTLFSVDCDLDGANDIRDHAEVDLIMSRGSYEKSHEIARSSGEFSGLIYPSCRAPGRDPCAAMFELSAFGKSLRSEQTLHFSHEAHSVRWFRHGHLDLSVSWDEVSGA